MARGTGRARRARSTAIGAILLFGAAIASPSRAATTVAPFSNYQPSLAITQVVDTSGTYPSFDNGGAAAGATLGFVYSFAGDYAPYGTLMVRGQVQSISSNTPLYGLLGFSYGENSNTTFALPNLDGKAIRGASFLGETTGTPTVTIAADQLPGSNGFTGQALSPFDNRQPALGLQTLIATSAPFPTAGTSTFLGQIGHFAGTRLPDGWSVADGSLLSIASNQALFAILGNTYGGDGLTTFALPDLRGRLEVGASAGHSLGTAFGSDATSLTAEELAGTPVDNDQASLAVRYLIATRGVYPSEPGSGGTSGFNATNPTIGQIVEYAGVGIIPTGYVLAEGQLLSIALNSELYSFIGTTYGGDGIATFALPDFRGRTAIGAGGTYGIGDRIGADQVTLSVTTTSPPGVPEPATWATMIAGFGLIGGGLRRRRRQAAFTR